MEGLYTVGQIAKQLKMSQRQVAYRITMKDIEPAGRAGTLRLFTPVQIEEISDFKPAKGGRPKMQLSGK